MGRNGLEYLSNGKRKPSFYTRKGTAEWKRAFGENGSFAFAKYINEDLSKETAVDSQDHQ